MTKVSSTPELQKKHPEVAAHAAAIVASMPGKRGLTICEAGDGQEPKARGDRLVVLERNATPAMALMGSNAVRLAYCEEETAAARAALIAAAIAPGEPVAADSGTIAMLNLAERVGQSDIPVLVEGPTGTGKEVLAQFIHRASTRADGPFVAVNCAAMPETMLEALLFGHRKGAFTGATEANEGFFRAADGGTLLLDELGEMPLSLQAKLLRVLEEGEVVPLGATAPVPIDVRIIACTNRDLPQEIAAGRFREDLYFRLNVFPLQLEALRQRPADIAPLAFAMLLRHAPDPAKIAWLSGDAIARLETHPWPGNVRELANVIRRAILLLGDGPVIGPEHIVFDHKARMVAARELAEDAGDNASRVASGAAPRRLSSIARQSEMQAIVDTLHTHDGNRQATARALGISERTLRYRLASMRDAGMLAAGGAR